MFLSSESERIQPSIDRIEIIFAEDPDDKRLREFHFRLTLDADTHPPTEPFAWIIPVPAQPELLLSEEEIFNNVDRASAPSFIHELQEEGCRDTSLCAVSDFGTIGLQEEGPENPGAPSLTRAESVPLKTDVVFGSEEFEDFIQWTIQNDFEIPADTRNELQSYTKEGFFLQVLHFSGAKEGLRLQPIALRYEGSEVRLPFRFSKSLSNLSIDLRFYFLGARRWFSTNFNDVELNPFAFKWTLLGIESEPIVSQYDENLLQALQESETSAFVSEYAGTSEIVSQANVRNPGWRREAFTSIELEVLSQELHAQGLIDCPIGESCSFFHHRVRYILRKYLPVPTGIDESDFYRDLEQYQELVDQELWSASEFSDELNRSVFIPADRSLKLLRESTYLTRLRTIIDFGTTEDDPVFHSAAGLEDISNERVSAWHLACDGPSWLQLEGKQIAAEDEGYPDLDLPRARRILSFSKTGESSLVQDNRSEIADSIERWNRSQHVGPNGCRTPSRNRFDRWAFILGLLGVLSINWIRARL